MVLLIFGVSEVDFVLFGTLSVSGLSSLTDH